MSRGKLGGHSQPGLIRPTADSNPYALRNILRHGDGTERTEFPLQREWDTGSDNPRGGFGVVYHNTDADVSVIDNIPNTKARWDKNYPGPGVTGPAESGPAMKRLQRGESS